MNGGSGYSLSAWATAAAQGSNATDAEYQVEAVSSMDGTITLNIMPQREKVNARIMASWADTEPREWWKRQRFTELNLQNKAP